MGSVGEELERLDRLLANRDITKGEYESLKAELLQWVRSGNSEADSQEIAAPDLSAGSGSDSWRFRHWFLNALIDLGLLTAIVLTTTLWIPDGSIEDLFYGTGLGNIFLEMGSLVGVTTVWAVRWRHGGKPAEGVPAHRQLDILVGSVVGTVGLAVSLTVTLVRFVDAVAIELWDKQLGRLGLAGDYSRREVVAGDLLCLVTFGFVWWWYWWRNARRTVHLFTVKRFRLAVYGVLVLAPVGGALYEFFPEILS